MVQISSVLISLFACSHAFRSRSPLPQFLPAPRLALANVSAALNEHFEDIQALAQTRHRTTDSSQASLNNELAILYGFAENEALAEVCEALDEVSFSLSECRSDRKAIDCEQDTVWSSELSRSSCLGR